MSFCKTDNRICYRLKAFAQLLLFDIDINSILYLGCFVWYSFEKTNKSNKVYTTVDYYVIGIWFNSISDSTTIMPQSQNFIGFYHVDFSWFNNTWFNS